MALPRPSTPLYNAVIPSTKQKVKYRPFTVREEKILMLAAESQDSTEVANAVETVINNCLETPIDVRSLATFDIEYLFLRLRAKSVGEKIYLKTVAPDDESTEIDIEIDIDKIGVEIPKEHTNKIKFSDNFMVVMKYPNIEFFSEGIDLSNLDASSNVLARCISQIVDGEEVYQAADQTNEEIFEWIESLTSGQYAELEKFINTMPRLRHIVKTKNPVTGKSIEIPLEGLADFFQ